MNTITTVKPSGIAEKADGIAIVDNTVTWSDANYSWSDTNARWGAQLYTANSPAPKGLEVRIVKP